MFSCICLSHLSSCFSYSLWSIWQGPSRFLEMWELGLTKQCPTRNLDSWEKLEITLSHRCIFTRIFSPWWCKRQPQCNTQNKLHIIRVDHKRTIKYTKRSFPLMCHHYILKLWPQTFVFYYILSERSKIDKALLCTPLEAVFNMPIVPSLAITITSIYRSAEESDYSQE